MHSATNCTREPKHGRSHQDQARGLRRDTCNRRGRRTVFNHRDVVEVEIVGTVGGRERDAIRSGGGGLVGIFRVTLGAAIVQYLKERCARR